ncbi:MAG: TIGR02757 family protein [Prevotellaceae bacterium]|nr:TIGR02757 family protein [Prevotellaceae bacterium]
MTARNIKDVLDRYSESVNVPAFIDSDPVKFVHKYNLLQDIEVAGILSAINAWGRRDMILRDITRILDLMGKSPYDFVMSANLNALSGNQSLHRTFNMSDLGYLCRGLRNAYSTYSTIEQYFADKPNLFDGIKSFRMEIISANEPSGRSSRHLSNPDANSACKRLHLFLRWMVRNDGIVDLGVWKNLSPSELFIPLDVHVGKVSRSLGLVSRKQNDRKTVEELTSVLRQFNPSDPIIYDFALFGIGLNMQSQSKSKNFER